jgi:hypothetical protein
VRAIGVGGERASVEEYYGSVSGGREREADAAKHWLSEDFVEVCGQVVALSWRRTSCRIRAQELRLLEIGVFATAEQGFDSTLRRSLSAWSTYEQVSFQLDVWRKSLVKEW